MPPAEVFTQRKNARLRVGPEADHRRDFSFDAHRLSSLLRYFRLKGKV